MGNLEMRLTPIFERGQLQQYIQDNPQLEREIIGLFLAQLPEILTQLANSQDARDWRLWTHTLKGSAMSVGAKRIEQAAIALEDGLFHEDSPERRARLAALEQLAAEFSGMAKHLYA
jgi:HPt (histidine-containing phosphotransfer) domain-containing protein